MVDNYKTFINIFISIVFGIIVGYLFKNLLFRNSIVYRGPNSNSEKFKIYKEDGECYMMVPKVCICPIDLTFDYYKN